MDYQDISHKLDEIEAEMKQQGIRIGGEVEPLHVKSAFGGAEMAFEPWLSSVFLPAARKAVAEHNLPANSQVGVAAMRNFDGYDEMDRLISLLHEFDRAVVASAKRRRPAR